MSHDCFYCQTAVSGGDADLRRHYETHATRVGLADGAPPMWTFTCPQCGPSGFPWLKKAEVAHAMQVHVGERHPA